MGRAEGKVVIVTGASRGIGAEIAKTFAAAGAKVVCAARTLREGEHPFEGSLEKTVGNIEAAGGTATAVAVNLGEQAECERLVQAARDTYGPVDVLVNNAAVTYFIPIKDYPAKRWLVTWAVNVHAPFYLTQAALQDMVSRKSGSIVNISSSAAIGPGRGPYERPASLQEAAERELVPGGTVYGMQKAALERFSQGLAMELYEYGISVTCISPSHVVPTPGTTHHKLVTGPEDPRGEPPEQMAQAVLLLATEPLDKVSGWVTYSHVVLKEYGLIDKASGVGIDRPGTGYSGA